MAHGLHTNFGDPGRAGTKIQVLEPKRQRYDLPHRTQLPRDARVQQTVVSSCGGSRKGGTDQPALHEYV